MGILPKITLTFFRQKSALETTKNDDIKLAHRISLKY